MQATFENTQLSRPQPLQPDSTGGVQWLTANQEVVAALRTQCQADHCILTPELNAELFERVRQEQFPYFQPETRTGNAPSLVTYPHNRYAIAGRNPTRMLVIAQDTQAFPTQLEQAPTITHTNSETTVSELQQLQAGIYFFDITSEKPGRDTVTITNTITNSAGESAGESAAGSSGQTLEETVYFAPNCKNEKLYCLTHPRAAWWYLQVLLRDQFRE